MNQLDADVLQQRLHRLERRLRSLSAYAAISTTLFLIVFLGGFQSAQQRQRFTEIDVERINIVEPNGRLALVIANEARTPGVIWDGKEISDRSGAAGLVFYNAKGNEMGGLLYGSSETDSTYSSGGSLTFDQYNQDQVVQLTYQDFGRRGPAAGLVVTDRPVVFPVGKGGVQEARKAAAEREGYEWTQRVFVGSADRTAQILLRDMENRRRIKMFVDSVGAARLEFYDTVGNVVYRVPQQ